MVLKLGGSVPSCEEGDEYGFSFSHSLHPPPRGSHLSFLSLLSLFSTFSFFPSIPFLERERERVCLHTPTCTGSVIFGKVACVHVSYNIVINHKVLHFNLVLYSRPHHHGVPLYDREGSCSPKQTCARCKTWCFSCFE